MHDTVHKSIFLYTPINANSRHDSAESLKLCEFLSCRTFHAQAVNSFYSKMACALLYTPNRENRAIQTGHFYNSIMPKLHSMKLCRVSNSTHFVVAGFV